MASEDEVRKIPLVWEEEGGPIVFANQFLIQHQPDEFVLTFGQVVTPPLLGTDEQKREQLDRLHYVPVRVLGRFGFTRRRMEELIAVLKENLDRHDTMMMREVRKADE